MAFSSKSLINAEPRQSNTGKEALGILHGLEKSHHYCFAHKISMITDCKSLGAIFKEDATTMTQ